MNIRRQILVLGFFAFPIHTVVAQSRGSADYALVTETIDFGGTTATSADYANTGSIASITDISRDTPSATVARSGYIGQLYERLGLGMIASDFYPPEENSVQFTGVHTNDDGTNDAIPGELLTWEILGGPLTGIDANGLAGTGPVHESTEAIVRGTVFSTPLQLSIHVQDTLADNFGLYAGDGIDDAWQKLHFGLANPLAAALLDPDGDGQTNHFEFVAGLTPTDQASRFSLRIENVPDQPDQKRLRFGPVFHDRQYTVTSSAWLPGEWTPIENFLDDGGNPERMVIDLAPAEGTGFYRVEINKP